MTDEAAQTWNVDARAGWTVAAVAAIAAVAIFWLVSTGRDAADAADLTALLPAESQAVVEIDVAALRSGPTAEIFRKTAGELEAEEGLPGAEGTGAMALAGWLTEDGEPRGLALLRAMRGRELGPADERIAGQDGWHVGDAEEADPLVALRLRDTLLALIPRSMAVETPEVLGLRDGPGEELLAILDRNPADAWLRGAFVIPPAGAERAQEATGTLGPDLGLPDVAGLLETGRVRRGRIWAETVGRERPTIAITLAATAEDEDAYAELRAASVLGTTILQMLANADRTPGGVPGTFEVWDAAYIEGGTGGMEAGLRWRIPIAELATELEETGEIFPGSSRF